LRGFLLRISTGLVLATALIAFCVFFVDRPLADYVARFHLYERILASAPFNAPILATLGLVLVVAGASIASGDFVLQPSGRVAATAAVLSGLALSWGSSLIELVLKHFFGRHFPLDYLNRGVYGFDWFSQSDDVGSFPSGHAAQITAVASVLWAFYPKIRMAYLASVGLVAVALLLAERHFLSDILAGGLIGVVSGFLMIRLWKAHLNFRL